MNRQILRIAHAIADRGRLATGYAREIILIGLLLVGAYLFYAYGPLPILQDRDRTSPTAHLELLEDKQGLWTLRDVTTDSINLRFAPALETAPRRGYTTSVYWLRLTVCYEGLPERPAMLELANKSLDHVSLFMPTTNGAFRAWHVGEAYPFTQRPVRHPNFVFQLPLPATPQQTLYLRIDSKGPVNLPVTVWSAEAFARKDHHTQFFLGMFFGILAVMTLYNLFLFLSIKDDSYFYYVLFIASYLLYQLTIERIAFEHLWPDQVWWNERAPTTLGLFCVIWALQFTRVFLETNRLVPRLDQALRGLMVACVPLMLLNLLIRHPVFNQLATSFTTFTVVVMIAAAVFDLRRGNGVARYYLLAWSFLLVGVLLGMFSLQGLLPHTFWGTRSAQVGAVFQVILLSLGLGYRYKALHKEREHMRLRIAADLHDDIGCGLTQISLYSELIRRGADGRPAEWAAKTGELARTLANEMRDIVWAIRPEEENWEALELRMKDYAASLLSAQDIALDMQGTQEYMHHRLSPDVRQNVLLMFKEMLHNAVRHAQCTKLDVAWCLTRQALWLRVRDDGCGFDPALVRLGNGLKNLQNRAATLDALLSLRTAPGQPTCIEVTVPL